MRFESEELDFTVHKDMPWNHIKKQYFKHLSRFVKVTHGARVFGNINYPLYKKLAEELGITLIEFFASKATTLWVFDCIESLIDPSVVFTGRPQTIYVTCPNRVFVPMWSHNHWVEYDPERFKVLAEYYGYKVIRHESRVIWKKWYQYLGFRAILRLFFPYHLNMYELKYV